ncbi:hypothetical protein RB195_016852 [Necator americanus]|uniref:Uncharacterized protein n=1 Tax=Necator americanus TaxID=51031 RepID=A0ABR1C4Q0_NECAM
MSSMEKLNRKGSGTHHCFTSVTTSNGVERIADIRTATVICWFPRNQSAISALKRQSRREKSRAGSESRKAALIGFEYFGFDHCLNDEQLINGRSVRTKISMVVPRCFLTMFDKP